MGFPSIPNMTPSVNITRQEVVNLLLSSIAFEELGLAHILNAEAEKIQALLTPEITIGSLIEGNQLVHQTLKTVMKKEMLLQFKLENVTEVVTETTTTTSSTSTTSTTTTIPGNCGGCSVRAVLGEGQSMNFTGSFDGQSVTDAQGDVNINQCGPNCQGNTDTMKFNSSGRLIPSGDTYTLSFNGNRSQLTCSTADGTFMLIGSGKVTGNNPFPQNATVVAIITFTSPDIWHVEITDGTTVFVADFHGTPNTLSILNCS